MPPKHEWTLATGSAAGSSSRGSSHLPQPAYTAGVPRGPMPQMMAAHEDPEARRFWLSAGEHIRIWWPHDCSVANCFPPQGSADDYYSTMQSAAQEGVTFSLRGKTKIRHKGAAIETKLRPSLMQVTGPQGLTVTWYNRIRRIAGRTRKTFVGLPPGRKLQVLQVTSEGLQKPQDTTGGPKSSTDVRPVDPREDISAQGGALVEPAEESDVDSLAEPNLEDKDAHDSFRMALQAGAVSLDVVQADKHFESMLGSLQTPLQAETQQLAEELELFKQLATTALTCLEARKM